MNEKSIQSVIQTSVEKIKEMVDSETIIGTPITVAEDAIVIPVSKVSFGFASGGSDLPSKLDKELFGGGAGAGASIQPVAFITYSKGEFALLKIDPNDSSLLGKLPEAIEKITAMFKKKKDEPTE